MSTDKRKDIQRFKEFVAQTPELSGVYIMYNVDDTIIYVGKAKSLKKRLASYFTGQKDIKTKTLVSKIERIETIIVQNEYEALLLENTLIKQHSPRYNISLKDGKTYPAIKITNEDFPRVYRTRKIIHDGSQYYGPFPSTQIMDQYLELIQKIVPLRRCKTLRKRASPCMYYHIGKCPAPCADKISKADYKKLIDKVDRLLSGKTVGLIKALEADMKEEAEALHFEKAAQIRDTIRAIGEFSADNQVIDFDPLARDYIAYFAQGSMLTFVVFKMRQGKLSGRDLFRETSAGAENESLSNFIMSYYSEKNLPPESVYVPLNEDFSLLEAYFLKEFSVKARFLIPSDKRHEAALALARQNAKEDLQRRLKETGDIPALQELRQALNLDRLPRRIEGFDIAQLGGKYPVASLISFYNGAPDKKNYRYFKIKTLDGKVDDFESIREAVARRYSRLVNENLDLPDLIMIDGGIGQVDAAKGILDSLDLLIPVVGLAKRNEELWLPYAKEPIVLSKASPALHVLQNVRDETHRFATGLNQKLRSKEELKITQLETIQGIGAVRAKKLLTSMGSLEAIIKASPEELTEKCGISLNLSKAIIDALNQA